MTGLVMLRRDRPFSNPWMLHPEKGRPTITLGRPPNSHKPQYEMRLKLKVSITAGNFSGHPPH